VLIVGAGGAARAIAFEAHCRGAEVLIANRTRRRAKRLAREFGLEEVSFAEIPGARFDILVNATPLGMDPGGGEIPLSGSQLKGKVVFDTVYNPPVTRLLRRARRGGARTVSGVEMFLNQAAIQSRLFTGRRPDISGMRRTLMRLLRKF
jgi:3-dehydroquinate dehydratase/shikimate dehydrogenase